ncbi:hypothetical protein FOQG_00901 [Fusarium oxysporum f. sp. raphani 54005]|uniref:Uncharacterized protein n=2 Tax=Fusarium oxysporum TaxID=5507 RepID=X0D3L3_FUSOX|nr:hypothetical protein FOVG_02679 [Fusarium oxysporum f. sp. pisi HDV247]EXL01017.1 hypothetical protein FOQG_00901 [Fusarium oxysporum f. sp. raphani 54005]
MIRAGCASNARPCHQQVTSEFRALNGVRELSSRMDTRYVGCP